MLNANHLDLIGIGHFGQLPAIKIYKVQGDTRTFLRADVHPNALKLIPIENGQRGRAVWIKRCLINR